ncbi:MAG: hypothetical protein ABI431_01875 [Candidatus Tumulicola sp.]
MLPPYRLDLTVDALRRVPSNLVDVMMPDGRYVRALAHAGTVNVVEVQQISDVALDVRISGRGAQAQMQTVATMLGAAVDLHEWYERSKHFPWLERLANELRGLKPPRYPELWEALCHGIIFQQLSIAAAASIMQRFVERFSHPIRHGSTTLHPFPRPQAVGEATEREFRSIGLSRMKVSYLKGAAHAVLTGTIDAVHVDRLPTSAALAEMRTVRGIGRWSAAVVLLRGFGRLDVFPPTDSGASRSMKLLSANPRIDQQNVLVTLDGVRGMLYFHLLLGRLRGLHSLT